MLHTSLTCMPMFVLMLVISINHCLLITGKQVKHAVQMVPTHVLWPHCKHAVTIYILALIYHLYNTRHLNKPIL